MPKNLWIIANWKSNNNIAQALEWVSKVGPGLHLKENVKVVVCPEFDALEEVKKAVQVGGWKLEIGAQDLSPFGVGAYTGEEAAQNLSQLISLAILGHSERRQNFGETDAQVAKKVVQAQEHNITPLVCVQGKETPVPEDCRLIAYEPVFAIGTGQPDTPQDANEVAVFFQQKYGRDLTVLYGGSVNQQNAKAFIEQENISGLLVGKSSLDPEEFLQIVNVCEENV